MNAHLISSQQIRNRSSILSDSNQPHCLQQQKNNHNKRLNTDRFIPTHIHKNLYHIHCQSKHCLKGSENTDLYANMLQSQVLGNQFYRNKESKKEKLLDFSKNTKKRIEDNFLISDRIDKPKRRIQKAPFKILEAPSLQDDFYLNLLDWSSDNIIAVGLESSVYLWSGCSSKIHHLYQSLQTSDYICSIAFATNPYHLGFGNTLGTIKIWDVIKNKEFQNINLAHSGRIGSISWRNGLIASGGRDGNVVIRDIRSQKQIIRYKAHSQQICGLKWSPQGSMIASGGNDNKLVIWSAKNHSELMKFNQHKAAVKAISWCPQISGMLASGGGTADRHIRFFSTQLLLQTHSIDTGSQVCNLSFSKISNEMVSTHGYSLNHINVWNGNKKWQDYQIEKVCTLTGHTYRVLYLASSPSGQSVLTGAGDESLRFWNVFDNGEYKKDSYLMAGSIDLR